MDPTVNRMWWLSLLRATAALLLGASVLVSGETRSALGNFIAVYWLIGSLLTFRWLAAHRTRRGRPLVLAAALVGLVSAFVTLLRFPLERVVSQELVLHLLGVVAILTGLLRLAGALRDDELAVDRPRLSYRSALGGLELVPGLHSSSPVRSRERLPSPAASGDSSVGRSSCATPSPSDREAHGEGRDPGDGPDEDGAPEEECRSCRPRAVSLVLIPAKNRATANITTERT